MWWFRQCCVTVHILSLLHGNTGDNIYVCLHIVTTDSELVKGTGSELASRLKHTHTHTNINTHTHARARDFHQFSASSFATLCWAAKCSWLVLHANERQETSNAAGNWRADLVRCRQPWPGSGQSLYVLTNDFTPWHQRDRIWVRERLTKAFN